MTQTVTVPQVGTFDFPDGMSEEDMQGAIQEHLKGSSAPSESLGGQIGKDLAGFGLGTAQGVSNLGQGIAQAGIGP